MDHRRVAAPAFVSVRLLVQFGVALLQRLEGKEYVVADGDVLNIRFNV